MACICTQATLSALSLATVILQNGRNGNFIHSHVNFPSCTFPREVCCVSRYLFRLAAHYKINNHPMEWKFCSVYFVTFIQKWWILFTVILPLHVVSTLHVHIAFYLLHKGLKILNCSSQYFQPYHFVVEEIIQFSNIDYQHKLLEPLVYKFIQYNLIQFYG